jgi:hypothetical protein
MAALSALELYASTIDDNAKYIVSGSASTSPGPLENTLLDNVNSVRDLTDHISGYVRGLGIPPATLQRRRPATLARVESALAHAEAALASVPKREKKRFKTDADPARVKAELAALRTTLGVSSGKAVTMLPSQRDLRNTSLEQNVKAAGATITSIFAGNANDIDRLAQQVREIAVLEPGVELEMPDHYKRHTRGILTALALRLDALEAKVSATKKNDEYLAARGKLDRALAIGAYGRPYEP